MVTHHLLPALVFGVTQYHDYCDNIIGTEGNFRLTTSQVGGVNGVLIDGHVGEKSFWVTGIELLFSGNRCDSRSSFDVVISGKCGTDVTNRTLYKAKDKVIGRFTGNVECHTTQSAR